MSIQSILEQKEHGVYHILPEASVSNCIELLSDKNVGALIVMDENRKLLGIVSERDVLHIAASKKFQMWELRVRDIMTPARELITVTLDETLESIMSRMTDNHIRHIPVMDEQEVIGIISIGDIVKKLLSLALEENAQMKDYIYGRYAVG